MLWFNKVNVLIVYRSKATIFTDSDLYPAEKFQNGSLIEVDGDVFCSNSSGAPSNIGIVISKSSMVRLKRLWWIRIDLAVFNAIFHNVSVL